MYARDSIWKIETNRTEKSNQISRKWKFVDARSYTRLRDIESTVKDELRTRLLRDVAWRWLNWFHTASNVWNAMAWTLTGETYKSMFKMIRLNILEHGIYGYRPTDQPNTANQTNQFFYLVALFYFLLLLLLLVLLLSSFFFPFSRSSCFRARWRKLTCTHTEHRVYVIGLYILFRSIVYTVQHKIGRICTLYMVYVVCVYMVLDQATIKTKQSHAHKRSRLSSQWANTKDR